LSERADAVGEQAGARAAETEQLRRLPDELAAALISTGLPRALVPARYGGGEHALQEVVDAIERLGYHDGSFAWCGMIAATTGLSAAYLPADWAERIYGDPATITGGFAMPVGTAVEAEGGLLVNGRWQWGSGTHHCTWIGGGCWVVDAGGAPAPRGVDGLNAPFVFFERGEVQIHDTWRVSGLRGTGSNDFEVVDVLVPEGRWVEFARAAPVVDGPLYRFPFLGALALGICAVSLGLARRAQDELVALAGGKRPAGSSRSLAERPVVQAAVARAEAAWRSAAALVREAIADAWEEAGTGRPLTDEHRRRLRLAATNATWQSAAAVDLMYHAGGGSSIHEHSPLQRVFRDVHVATQHAMVADRTLEPLGRMALGLPTDARQL
jgi:alkylation response protein AidB-like acyl-CoA dehydrogenase